MPPWPARTTRGRSPRPTPTSRRRPRSGSPPGSARSSRTRSAASRRGGQPACRSSPCRATSRSTTIFAAPRAGSRASRSSRPSCSPRSGRRRERGRDDRGAGLDQALRRRRGARGNLVHDPRGRGRGLLGPQRRGQDDHAAHPGGRLPAVERRRAHRRPRPPRRAARLPPRRRVLPRVCAVLPRAAGGAVPGLRRPAQAYPPRRAPRRGRPRARGLRARRRRRAAGGDALEGLPAARRPRASTLRGSADPRPRRAHDRPRPGAGGRDPGAHRSAARCAHGALLEPHLGRGGARVRARDRDRARPARGRGEPGGAGCAARRRRARLAARGRAAGRRRGRAAGARRHPGGRAGRRAVPRRGGGARSRPHRWRGDALGRLHRARARAGDPRSGGGLPPPGDRPVIALLRKELALYFSSPLFYLLAAVFFALGGWFFYTNLSFYVLMGGMNLSLGFWQYQFFDLRQLLLVLIPLLTMRLFAEERELGTLELLWTYPLRDAEIVAGKFLACLAVVGALLLGTGLYPLLVAPYQTVAPGPLVAGYLGLGLLAAACVACGLFRSALTDSQLVAGASTYGLLLLFWVLTWNEAAVGAGALRVLKPSSSLPSPSSASRSLPSTPAAGGGCADAVAARRPGLVAARPRSGAARRRARAPPGGRRADEPALRPEPGPVPLALAGHAARAHRGAGAAAAHGLLPPRAARALRGALVPLRRREPLPRGRAPRFRPLPRPGPQPRRDRLRRSGDRVPRQPGGRPRLPRGGADRRHPPRRARPAAAAPLHDRSRRAPAGGRAREPRAPHRRARRRGLRA